MSNLTVTLVISSGSGGLALTVSAANGYTLTRDGLGTGRGSMRRQTAQSPWVRGRTLVHAVEDNVVTPVEVRVKGTSWADHNTKLNALINAFRQTNYILTVTVEGNAEVWNNCEPADIAYGGQGATIDPFEVRNFSQLVRLLIPHDPP